MEALVNADIVQILEENNSTMLMYWVDDFYQPDGNIKDCYEYFTEPSETGYGQLPEGFPGYYVKEQPQFEYSFGRAWGVINLKTGELMMHTYNAGDFYIDQMVEFIEQAKQ